MDFTIQIANKIIRIESIFPELKTFCKEYLTEDITPDFSVHLTEEDIRTEHNLSADPDTHSPQYLETLVALRKIAEKMPFFQRMLMHGAAITYCGDAFLFTAPSDTGKSTHIKLWKKYLCDKVDIINGDKPILSFDHPFESEELISDSEHHPKNNSPESQHVTIRIHGTPWSGKEHWQKNQSGELKGICLLKQSPHNSIQRIQPADFLPELMKQIYFPTDTRAAEYTLDLLNTLLTQVPLYLLNCNISEEAVACSFEALTGTKYPR